MKKILAILIVLMIFGGGMGSGTAATTKATTLGNVIINYNTANANLTGLYGGANVNGDAAGDIAVNIEANVGTSGSHIDVFGGANAPLVVAAAQRSTPVTNLIIPRFCVTEITDEPRFSNDELSWRPFTRWADDFEDELARNGPSFQQSFGTNTME